MGKKKSTVRKVHSLPDGTETFVPPNPAEGSTETPATEEFKAPQEEAQQEETQQNEVTNQQQLMVEDGLPKEAILTDQQREEGWKENPPKPAASLIEGPPTKEVPPEILEFAKEEESRKKTKTQNRIAKMVNKVKSPDPKTHRWDTMHNRWVPLDKTVTSTKATVPKTTATSSSKKVKPKEAGPKKTKPTDATVTALIALLLRKNGATIKDLQEAGWQRSAKAILTVAERQGLKTSTKKEPGQLTRYFAVKK